MCEVIDRLCADHRNMTIVLDFVSDEMDKLGFTVVPAFELLSDSMRYLVEYADNVHHPHEEIVFHQVTIHTSQLDDIVETLTEEHDQIYQDGNELFDWIDAVENGQHDITTRQLRSGRDYVFLQTRHMQLEESTVFPIATDFFSTQEWESIQSSYLMQDDPLFGDSVEPEYQSLRIHLDEFVPSNPGSAS